MNPEFIEARDLPDAWFQAIARILDKGVEYTVERGSFAGQKRREFDYITIHIKHPGTRPLIPEIPAHLGIPAPVSMDYVEDYLPYLMTDVKMENEQYTYGERISLSMNKVIKMYKEQGSGTNQAIMEIGQPKDIDLSDPPCLRLIDTRIRYGKLHFIIYFRSWDLWGGFPANLAGLQLMKEYMAGEIGVEDGEIIASSKGLHLYEYSWDLARLRRGIK
ncbi:MAG: thymidylate synthase [Candidatus Firestonebacteria bacterium]|nr:thymidylate synthase [Candidatus Firestonebacteria bacterium]